MFWGFKGRTKLRVFTLSDVLEKLIAKDRFRHLLEFAVFIALGCFVGIGITDPKNPQQALTAGLAWTGVFSSSSRRPNALGQPRKTSE